MAKPAVNPPTATPSNQKISIAVLTRSDYVVSMVTEPSGDWDRVATRIYRGLERRLGVDTRALAAFRISLGLLLLVDLLLRARDLGAHYTDEGVLPVALLAERYPTLSRLSLHALSGDAWLQVVLFALAGACALVLLVGYRTRIATAASLCLLASLHIRNPYVLSGGDALLQHLLFWSLFLPLGARWSVDARRRAATRERVFTPASAAILAQVVLVYGVNAVLKHRSGVWLTGGAVESVFGLDRFTVLLGNVVRDLPAALWLANWIWLGALLSSPLLLFLTGRRRTALVGAFGAMHLGMLLTMHLGIFPLVSMVALVPFLPGAVWDRLGRVRRPRAVWSAILDRLDRVLPVLAPNSATSSLGQWGSRAAQATAAAVLVGLVLFNAIGLGFVQAPPPADDALSESRSDLRWVMFANPSDTDRWYVAPGTLESGERVDAFDHGEIRWQRPDDVTRTYSSARMRKYMSNLRYDEGLQSSFPAYLCERWNRTHGDGLVDVSLYAVETPSHEWGTEARRRTELVSASCTAG